MTDDPWYADYQAARQKRLALTEAPPPAAAASDAARNLTCAWCGRYAPHYVERYGPASGPWSVRIRTCALCGRSTSRMEDCD